ncbi:MAG TPA: hypothetical protein DF712_12760 [Balneola sp.]|nr:hypothetical protein [Bacteroidota bacterium]MAB66518.1 hypothetical protein [Bacteroidota bacterium]HCT53316.1 hypothetical protein [Balneola sp.]|tara:strand:+ start:36 stop:791 length:756 start_codon:yes stop_codon:yes gene_type:complete
MKKGILYILIILLGLGSLYLGFRLSVQSQEFEKSRQFVETQTEELFVLRELLNKSDLKRDEVKAFFDEHYPSEDLGPYSSQIVWRNLDFYFSQDSAVAVYSTTSTNWTCGTLFGCVTSYPEFLDSYCNTLVGCWIANFANVWAYPSLIFFFILALTRVYKARFTEKLKFKSKCLTWSYGMLLFTVFIAFGSATAWWDLVNFTGASSSIIHSGWNELLLRIGIGILFSIVLILVGFKGQGIITPHKQTKPAL